MLEPCAVKVASTVLRRGLHREMGFLSDTILGVKMSGRISQDDLHALLKRIQIASQDDPARLQVRIDDEINKLKSDFTKNYDLDEDIF